MKLPQIPGWLRRHWIAACVAVGVTVGVSAVAYAVVSQPEEDNALVIASAGDCLRITKSSVCDAILGTAIQVHARYAPRFPLLDMCESSFGVGNCRDVELYGESYYAPTIAAIVVARKALRDPMSIVPVYAQSAASEEELAEGQRVFFRKKPAGTLQVRRYAGAKIASMSALDGVPVSGAWVREKRKF